MMEEKMNLAIRIKQKRKELNIFKPLVDNSKGIYKVVGFISNYLFNYNPGPEPSDRRYDSVVIRIFWNTVE
jgi:hypothetical protein